MTKSGHLWAIGYESIERAAQVRDEIIRLGERHCLVVLDTAVVVRFRDGTVTLNGERFLTGIDLHAHTLAGLFAGLALGATPLTSPVVGALLRGTGNAPDIIHIDEEFIAGVERLLKPVTSTLFVLDQEGDMDTTLHGIRGLGGTLLKTTVDLERAKLVQSALADIAP